MYQKKNLQSIKHVKSEAEVEEDSNFYLDAETVKTHELCTTIIPINLKRKGFSDLTGFSPYKSSRGNLYVMVMYDYDSNTILAEPIKKHPRCVPQVPQGPQSNIQQPKSLHYGKKVF